MKHLTYAIAGAGQRGTWLTQNVIMHLPEVSIAAISDPYEDKAQSLADEVEKAGKPSPKVYTDTVRMLDEIKPDALMVFTSWEDHITMAIEAMKRGIAAAMEVGGAYSEKECRDLVETYETTKTPIMFMENCCYNRDELLATSMARNGRFGDVVYCHGAYGHDLRAEVAEGDIRRHYRLRNYTNRNCENYPTHELGPIAKLLNITRKNRMVSLCARSSVSKGLHAYVQDKENLAYLKDRVFAQGDIVETWITCENGELISLKLDTTLPRYYSREFTVRGTKGLYNQDNDLVLLDDVEMEESFDTYQTMLKNTHNSVKYEEYLPAIWAHPDEQVLSSGHGGMDWFVYDAFTECLRKDKPMPIDVYDAAAWMCISYLTEESIRKGGATVEIPDFTHGLYLEREPEDVVELPKINK